MRLRWWLAAALVGALVFATAPLPALGQAEVLRTDVRVTIDGPVPHPRIVERLAATVDAAADRLVVGRPVDQLRPVQARLEETLAAVLDRIVPGYATSGVTLQLGAVTVVLVTFRPAGPVISAVDVLAAAPTVDPRVAPMVLGPLRDGAAEPFRGLYAGLPVAALPWAAAVLEPLAREVIERLAPGFTAAIGIRPGSLTVVDVTVSPRDSRVVRGIAVTFRSTSIPLLVLDDYEADVAAMADPLRGLPVEFARQRTAELAALIDRALAVFPPAVQYRIVATTMLDVGEATRVIVLADSVIYRARVEAQLSVGTSAPGPRINVHVGRLVTSGLEGYAELRIVPNTLAMRWTVGAAYALTPSTTVGLTYAPSGSAVSAWTTMRLSRDLSLRAAWDFRRRAAEGGLIYRVNEFLSGEIVGTSRGHFWLRLTSNL
ncbi:MAG: hypothetical protein ACRDFT_05690 [bacterium]